MREEICGDISKTNTMENKKYEYAKSYSNHDEIVEILSVEINSENHDKNVDEDDDDDDLLQVSFSMQRPKEAWKKLLKVADLFANGPIPASSANHR